MNLLQIYLKLSTYEGSVIKPVGEFKAKINYQDNIYFCNIIVVKKGVRPLLGRNVIKCLRINLNTVSEVSPTAEANLVPEGYKRQLD